MQNEAYNIFKKIKSDYIEDDERLINKIGSEQYNKYKHIFEDEHKKIINENYADDNNGIQYEQLYKYG